MKELATWISATPEIDTNIYAAGDLVGDLMEFDLSAFLDRPGLILQDVQIVDLDAEEAALDLVLFRANPANTTFTDNAELDIDDDDLPEVLAVVSVTTYHSFKTNSLGVASSLTGALRLERTGTMKIYGVLVSRGTPTYTAATDLTVKIGVVPL